MPHILIAEDDQFLASAYKLKFEKENIEVTLAQDGQEALDLIQQNIPELILLDLVMPIKDGFAVLSDLKDSEQYKNIPIIIASNLGQDEEIQKGLAMGATDYIVKSNTSLEEIIQKVHQVLAKNDQAIETVSNS